MKAQFVSGNKKVTVPSDARASLCGVAALSARSRSVVCSPRERASLIGKHLEDVFKQFDTDGSGTLDHSELKAAFAAAGREATDEQIEKAVKTMDSDGDGVIKYAHFKPARATTCQTSTPSALPSCCVCARVCVLAPCYPHAQ